MPEPRLLGVRRVDARSRRESQRQLAHVADDADDFNVQRFAAIDRQATADWIVRTEVRARQGRIDGDDRGRALDVAPIERATRDQRDAERAEVIGADHAQFSQRPLSLRPRRWSRAEPHARPEPARRQPVHDRRGLDAGQHFHALEHAGIETCQRRVPQDTGPAGTESRVVSTCAASKPGFGELERVEAADEEACADEQGQGQRGLEPDERRSRQAAPRSRAAGTGSDTQIAPRVTAKPAAKAHTDVHASERMAPATNAGKPMRISDARGTPAAAAAPTRKSLAHTAIANPAPAAMRPTMTILRDDSGERFAIGWRRARGAWRTRAAARALRR